MQHEPNGNTDPADAGRVGQTVRALQALRHDAGADRANALLDEAIGQLCALSRTSEASLARYRNLIDAVPDAVTLFDAEGAIIDANAAATRIYGYPVETLRTMNVHDLNPSLPPRHMQRLWATLDMSQSITEVTLNRRADGHTFPIEVHSRAYVDDGQRRVIAVARDISERRHTEAELRDSQARYVTLLQAMDKGVLVQDERGLLVSANAAACRLIGMEERELLALTRDDLAHWSFVDQEGRPITPRDLPGLRALVTGKVIDSAVYGIYLPHLHAYRWLSVSSVPDVDPASGRTRQVISTFSDVSALKRENEMFRATQQLGQIGCWELDDLRGTLYWTGHMYRIHDLPPDSPVSESRLLNFFTPASRRAVVAALADARNHATSFELQLEIVTAIGRRRWVSLRGQPMQRHGRIYGVIGTLQNIDERKAIEQALRREAATDPVTRLPNRDTLMAAVDAALAEATPGTGPALLYVDSDRFKVLNDMLGHLAGDRLLNQTAQRLVECAGDEARVGRYGNDEFLILIERCHGRAQAEALAARIVEAFASAFQHEGERFILTVSVGVAVWPEDGATSQALLLHADTAMVEAKRRGRNTWQAWRGMRDEPGGEERHLQIESQLRLALDNDEFHLVYQPQLDLARREVCGVEALLRWQSHTLGPQLPAAFIPCAEGSGDIVRIGTWVINEACRHLRLWRDRGVPIHRLSVNVSYRQVLSGNLFDTVEAALRDNGLSGDALELEMTERVLIENAADTQETFRALKRMGVNLVIDDFGEGYSSLNYLRNLPLDGVKISHSFMQGVPGDPTDEVICEAIVRIAHSLGLRVVAEGVETEAQRKFLLDLGVELAQGYLFARPQLASDIPACLARLEAQRAPAA